MSANRETVELDAVPESDALLYEIERLRGELAAGVDARSLLANELAAAKLNGARLAEELAAVKAELAAVRTLADQLSQAWRFIGKQLS